MRAIQVHGDGYLLCTGAKRFKFCDRFTNFRINDGLTFRPRKTFFQHADP